MTPETLAGGRYRLERRLGLGGMAVVHLARDTLLDRPVAIKLLAERFEDDRELRERFLREGRFAAQLSHPNVVAVFDTGEEDGRPYIVMEYADGSPLDDVLRRRHSLPPEEVVELARQVCAGLAHAHSAGLVHRDIKPHNLLLRDDGTLKIADFGIARSGTGGTITEAGTLLGTVAYMAPEVAEGQAATAASDIFSLGAVLYELLTGQPPRTIRTLADVTSDAVIRHPREHVPGAPEQLVATIMRCLDPDPLRRPSSAQEVVLELEDDGSAPTRSLHPTIRLRRMRPARRLWLALAALTAALLTALGLTLDGGGEQEPAEPPPVKPVRIGDSPAEDARNLADWLRRNSR